MILKYLFSICLILILRGVSFSQDSFNTNLDIVQNLIEESLTPLGNKLLILGKDNFYSIKIDNNNQAGSYLLDKIIRRFNDYKLIIGEDSDSTDYITVIKNPYIRTGYKKIFTDRILGTKKVQREVIVSYEIELMNKKTSSIEYSLNFNKSFKDNFDLDKLGLVEDNRYKFSRSTLPAESKLNEILFPSIIIAASAAAIVLFFIIRSK